MTRIKIVLLAAFAVFFVSGIMAQERPSSRPMEKADPGCTTIARFFGPAEHLTRRHPEYTHLRFAFVSRHKIIIIFEMIGPCIGERIILSQNHPFYKGVVELLFSDELV